MRLFDLAEPAAAIFAGVVPLIRLVADKCARRLAVAEIDPIHHDELVDDAADLARHLGALHLDLKSERAIEFVRHLFKDADKDDMLRPCVLKLVEKEQKFARVQPVSAAQIFRASTIRPRLGLLFGPAKTKTTCMSDAVDEDQVVTIEIFQPPPDSLEMRLGIAAGRRKRRVRSTNANPNVTSNSPIVDM